MNGGPHGNHGHDEHSDVNHDGEERVFADPDVYPGQSAVQATFRSASSRRATRPWLTRRLMLVVREPMAAARLAYE